MEYILVGTICLFVGLIIGHRMARVKIEEDCEKLGGFYMGKIIYHCTHIEKPEGNSSTAAPDLPPDHPMRKAQVPPEPEMPHNESSKESDVGKEK